MLFLTALFCMAAGTASAQTRTITGTVLGPDKLPVVGATVIATDGVRNAAPLTGTTTDISGNYSINAPAKATTLSIQFIGYETQTMPIGERTTINATLAESSVMMDEVVAIGYAKVRRKDLTGASASVVGDELKNIPVTTAAQALTGKAAGVNIVTQSGAPGAEINITVRGGTSITQSTAPLCIVDGFQIENGLQSVDINDIETIDVLKDASATAIYGARGSNGVILITTKSGKAGKTEVSYNTYFSFEKLGKELDLLGTEEYVKYQYEWQLLADKTTSWAKIFGGNPSDANFYTDAYARIAREYGSREGIDWQKEVFGGHGMTQSHNVNITTGTEKTQAMLSYNYLGQDGILSKSGYNKNSVRAKIKHELWKGVRFDMSSNFQQTKVEGGGSLGGALKQTILQPVTGGQLYSNYDMIHKDLSEDMSQIDTQYDINNPLIYNDAMSKMKYVRQFDVNAGIEIDFLKDFTWRTAGSYLWQQARTEVFDDGRTMTAKKNLGPYGNIRNAEKYSYQITNTLNWSHVYNDKHSVSALLGQEIYYQETMESYNEYQRFPKVNFGLKDVSMGIPTKWESKHAREGIVSFFARANYAYDDRYLFSATVRGDGSSKFAKGNQWGFFPSASAAWRISEEDFFKDSKIADVMSNFKVRVGYGTSGNCNIDNNMYATDFSSSDYPLNNTGNPTLRPGNTVGNKDLKWETTTSINVGLDMSFFRNRLNVTADWYNNQSDDLLIKIPIPQETGYTYQFQNIASIRNRGFEFVINSVNIQKKNFTWKSDLNMSFNKSRVIRIGNGSDRLLFNYPEGVDTRLKFLAREGSALGEMYGYKYAGVYTTDDFTQNADGSYALKKGVPYLKGRKTSEIKPGDVKYDCVAGQVDADGTPIWSTDDMTTIGNGQPLFTGGFSNSFAFHGFDVSIFMNFSYGNDVFNMSTQRFIGPYLPNQNTISVMNDRFVLVDPSTGRETTNLARLAQLNPNQHDPRQMWSLHSTNKIAISDYTDYYVEDGSYLRIGQITLGYTFPKELTRKIRINNARLYFTVNNVATLTGYSGYDPEVAGSSSITTPGVDDSSYPRARSYVVGLNLTF